MADITFGDKRGDHYLEFALMESGRVHVKMQHREPENDYDTRPRMDWTLEPEEVRRLRDWLTKVIDK
jgi:hypothetical protein